MKGMKKVLIKWIIVCLISQVLMWSLSHFVEALALASENAVEDSVIKIFTVYNEPNYDQPWQMNGQQCGYGSGCVISRKGVTS